MSLTQWSRDRARASMLRWVPRALAAIVAVLVAAAGAGAHSPDPIFSGRWNQDQSLQFAWRSGSVPASIYQTAIKAAAADASASRGSRAATFSYSAGASNLIGYGTGATCGPQGIACFSRNAPTSFTMWMREQGHMFDWGALRWCQAYSTWPSGCFDVQNIMLDEFGHVEILNHHANHGNLSDYSDAVVQALSRAKPTAGYNAHALGRCDVATLQVQYDMQSWGAKYSTCLDLVTTLSLGGSAPAVRAGASVTLTASLKVANDPNYSRLAANPVALRSVILERRAAGATSWTPVGAMPSTAPSGTYARTVPVTARTEFRAVFARPADEGLRASTSPTVVVVISP